MTAGPQEAPRSGEQRRLERVLGMLIAVGPLSIDMYLPALATIAAELKVSEAAVQLSLTSFFLGFACGQLPGGWAIDRFGRTRPMYVGLVLYVAASLACALAPDDRALIAFRGLQGLGGALVVVVPRAVVRDLHTGAAAAQMLSRLILIMGTAPIVAPLLGAQVLAAWGWRAIFVALAVFGAAALVTARAALADTWRPPPARASVAAGLVALLREPHFVAYALAGGCSQAGMFAYITGAPFVFITLHGVPEAQFGWFFGANALGYIAASQLNARLLARRSPAAVLRAAVAVGLVAGGLLLACAALEIGGLWGISAGLLVYVSCLGLVMPNATALAFERHGARAGLASAVVGSLQFGIGAAASGVLSALHDGTAVPMAAILAGSGALGWLVLAAHRRLTAGEASPTVEA